MTEAVVVEFYGPAWEETPLQHFGVCLKVPDPGYKVNQFDMDGTIFTVTKTEKYLFRDIPPFLLVWGECEECPIELVKKVWKSASGELCDVVLIGTEKPEKL